MTRDPDLSAQAAAHLRSAMAAGLPLVGRSPHLKHPGGPAAPPPEAPPDRVREAVPGPTGTDAAWTNSAEVLAAVVQEVAACQACRLCEQRTKTVPGTGHPGARLVFVGEGPGANEDRTGEPFVGRAGELLTRIIQAIGLEREQVYITNVVKCRPPGNRNPQPDEIAACAGYLERQLLAIRPDVICALGKPAALSLLGLPPTTPIGRIRGTFQDWKGIPVMPTYHPAYLLRNPAEKRTVWEDMKKVRDRLNGPLNGEGELT